jgi:hypothetical protein
MGVTVIVFARVIYIALYQFAEFAAAVLANGVLDVTRPEA